MASKTYSTHIAAALGLSALFFAVAADGQTFIVANGQPRAEIVIAEEPARMARLAASELQSYMEKITGAKLPIATAPSGDVPVRIYVGRSAHTDRLNLTDEGLKHGAFRMKSGGNWLALLGHDSDFTPPEPFAQSNSDIPRMLEEWDKLTGEKWSNLLSATYKRYNRELDIWENDDRGSLNAVYSFLRSLGVRWYMPGELGEIVPRMASIELPRVDSLTEPDFAMRNMFFAFHHMADRDDILWYLRLGLNRGREIMGLGQPGHGSRDVTGRDEVKKAHPEYYALYGGKRDTEYGGKGRPCLSSEGLLQANVRFARAVFDIYDEPSVSVMPQDGYANVCQCHLCQGKATPERGWYGAMSDYVWNFTERVARQVHETHPDKWITCYAYGTYLLPPETIAKLSPNIVVGMVYHRANMKDDDEFNRYEEIVNGWREKTTSGKMMRWAHYLHSRPQSPWHGLPVYYPHAIARDLRFLKDVSLGDFIEVSFGERLSLHAPEFNHLNIYVTSRLHWDAEQDVDKLLSEYYRDFYGPAAEEMRALVDYSEANWPRMNKEVEPLDKALELVKAAQEAAPDGTDYGKRVAMLAEYLSPMEALRDRLSKGREDVPEARGFPVTRPEGLNTYSLRDVETGARPKYPTTFRFGWENPNKLYFDIHCEEPDMAGLNVTATDDGDMGIWHGDCVELLLETQSHSYYQIAISPVGAVVDLNRKGGIDTQWSSNVDVTTHRGEDYWRLEVRVPLSGDMRGAPDPLNDVAGGRPTTTHPFFFNLCRQRVRNGETERTAFSPTGKDNFHDVLKFGKLYIR